MIKYLPLFVLFLFISACDDETPTIKVACIGDSITYGHGMPNRVLNCYPAQLQNILGPTYEVKNFSVSARTLLKKGDYPIWEEQVYKDAKAFEPDFVVIQLGTNDTKPQNWKHKADFISDYRSMIEEFESLPSVLKVWMVKPVPVYGKGDISDAILKNEILPMIDSIASADEVPIIDLYSALSNNAGMFPDGVHPDKMASGIMAGIVAASVSQ